MFYRMAREDVDMVLNFAAFSAALKAGVPGAEWDPRDELREKIAARDDVLAETLTSFIDAYEEWFKFNDDVIENGSAGNLTSEQTSDHVKLVGAVASTRAALLAAIRK
jgi:hypothetical protein